MKKYRKNSKGITLIALVITIVILLILAGITINQLTGENGLFARAKQAKESTQISNYKEQIELIKTELQLQSENYEEPTINQLKSKFEETEQKKWVNSTEIITDDAEEKLKLITKEGYIFYITGTTTEYKGKGEIVEASEPTVKVKGVDTSDLIRKTDKTLAELFEITWGSDGAGTIEYIVTGNLLFNNTSFSSTEISNLSNLELGTYTITCKAISPSNKIGSITKEDVKITTLANTSVTNENNENLEAKAIYSEYDLAYFRDLVNAGQTSINGKVMNDIDLTNVCSSNVESWTPIGNDSIKYSGVFDGEGFTIDNLYINTTNDFQGLFGYTLNSFIKSVVIGETSNVKGAQYTGGIVGYVEDTKILKCGNNAKITATANYVGGISGNSTNSELDETYNKGNIDGTIGVGGISGATLESKILYSYNTGTISSRDSFLRRNCWSK